MAQFLTTLIIDASGFAAVMTKRKSENVEEYLEALWILEERGQKLSKIVDVASQLEVSAPSAVEMFRKLEKAGYVEYMPYKGISLTGAGRKIASMIVRNHRLAEVLMKKALGEKIDEGVVCGMEHHMSVKFANALCRLLGHPRKCPHGNPIPKGACCP